MSDAELQFTGTVGTATYTDHIATAEDYARYAAAAMNAGTADDTEFIADGATVTAYVHGLAHMSAAFEPDEGRPYPGEEVQPATGTCEFCRADDVALPAVLSADPDQRACATCHADPRVPTFDASALDDETPVWTLTRGDLARLAGRVVTDAEAATIERALGYSTVMESVNGAVEQVCGFPPSLDDESD